MKTNHYHMLWSCARVRTRRDVMGTQWRAEVVTALCTEEYRSQQAAQKRKFQAGAARHPEAWRGGRLWHIYWPNQHWRCCTENQTLSDTDYQANDRRSLSSESSLSNGTAKRYTLWWWVTRGKLWGHKGDIRSSSRGQEKASQKRWHWNTKGHTGEEKKDLGKI